MTDIHNTLVYVIYNTIVTAIATIMVYLDIDKEAFGLFATLLFIDYITGIWKARTLGEKITSNKMKYGIISKFILIFIPIVFAIGTKALHQQGDSVLFVGLNILVLSEVYSILGNIYTVRTKEELPEVDAVAAIGQAIRKKLTKFGE